MADFGREATAVAVGGRAVGSGAGLDAVRRLVASWCGDSRVPVVLVAGPVVAAAAEGRRFAADPDCWRWGAAAGDQWDDGGCGAGDWRRGGWWGRGGRHW